MNGDYWHSDEFLKNSRKITAKEYHESKVDLAKEQGVLLLYIWESDWNDSKATVKSELSKVISKSFNSSVTADEIPEIFQRLISALDL